MEGVEYIVKWMIYEDAEKKGSRYMYEVFIMGAGYGDKKGG